jgi:hypothetical protein
MNKRFVYFIAVFIAVTAVFADTQTDKPVQNNQPKVLKNNVRLIFAIVLNKANEKEISVITASPWSEISTIFKANEFNTIFSYSGKVAIIDEENLLLNFNTHIEFNGRNYTAEQSAVSSVLLQTGKRELIMSSENRKVLVTGFIIKN